jgi:putative nucleotidyltransferase with HDIG domain
VEIDSYDNPDAEALLVAGEERWARMAPRPRELATQSVAAAAFLVAGLLLAALAAPWHRSLSVSSLLIVLIVWVVVERVKLPVAGGWTAPTMVVFVPALFMLPTPIVPLVAMLAFLLGRIPELLRVRTRVLMAASIADSWYTIGPALVIVLGGDQRFAWSHWPVYVGALLAHFVFDMTATVGRYWAAEGISPRVQLPLLTWLYLVDAALAPLGLLIAAAAVQHAGLVLLALSPTAMLLLFARERQQRMDETLALNAAYRGTALLIGDVVEAGHHYTGIHSREVVALSLGVADQLGLKASRRRNVEFAALLHDIGKMHVPREILNKPGPLSDEDWELIRRHTLDGEQMLEQAGGLLAEIAGIVRASHERWDGGGYPDGLAGERIPIEARIVSACDAFSAISSERPYQQAISTEQALAELRRCAGSQFDPNVVAEVERTFRNSVPTPRKRNFQPWQVWGFPKLVPHATFPAVRAEPSAEGLVSRRG